MVAKSGHGLGRHGVHGVGANQLFDIKDVAVFRALGPRARPQQPLGASAPLRKLLPARAGESAQIVAVRQLRVGDRHFAAEAGERRARSRILGLLEPLGDRLVDGRIDPADEEAGDAGHAVERPARGGERFEAAQIGLDHLFIDVLGEQQRDVDVDALADQRTDRRNARLGPRHLDHQVVAADRLPQPPRLGDGRRGVYGDIGRDFQADEAVATGIRVVDRAENVGGAVDVGDREPLVDGAHGRVVVRNRAFDVGVVGPGLDDCLFEDRGIGGDPADRILADQPLEASIGEKIAGQEIEPHRLAVLAQRLQRIHAVFHFETWALAAAAIFSGVKPNSLIRSFAGAEAPKPCMPMLAPSGPA